MHNVCKCNWKRKKTGGREKRSKLEQTWLRTYASHSADNANQYRSTTHRSCATTNTSTVACQHKKTLANRQYNLWKGIPGRLANNLRCYRIHGCRLFLPDCWITNVGNSVAIVYRLEIALSVCLNAIASRPFSFQTPGQYCRFAARRLFAWIRVVVRIRLDLPIWHRFWRFCVCVCAPARCGHCPSRGSRRTSGIGKPEMTFFRMCFNCFKIMASPHFRSAIERTEQMQ